ncbi:unnamed protein product, partial [Cyprideis torosa]
MEINDALGRGPVTSQWDPYDFETFTLPYGCLLKIRLPGLVSKTGKSETIVEDLTVQWWMEAVSKSTPLHVVSSSGNHDDVVRLIDRGASVDARDHEQCTPLHIAANRGHQNIALTLLDRGAQVDARDDKQQTPLHIAANRGHQNIALTLLDRSAQ